MAVKRYVSVDFAVEMHVAISQPYTTHVITFITHSHVALSRIRSTKDLTIDN